MEIKLLINGEEKTFTVPFIRAAVLKETIIINKNFDLMNMKDDDPERIADYLVFAFNNQFTRDDVIEGFPSNQLLSKMDDVMCEAYGIDKDKQLKEDEAKNEKTPTKS